MPGGAAQYLSDPTCSSARVPRPSEFLRPCASFMSATRLSVMYAYKSFRSVICVQSCGFTLGVLLRKSVTLSALQNAQVQPNHPDVLRDAKDGASDGLIVLGR